MTSPVLIPYFSAKPAETNTSPAGMEGMLTLKPTAAGLQRGLYTLVHSDGGETLLAYLNVVGDSLKLVFR